MHFHRERIPAPRRLPPPRLAPLWSLIKVLSRRPSERRRDKLSTVRQGWCPKRARPYGANRWAGSLRPIADRPPLDPPRNGQVNPGIVNLRLTWITLGPTAPTHRQAR